MQAERTIRKHVAIIHAYALMTSLQRKIFNVLLYDALNVESSLNHKDSVAVECRSSYANLAKAINYNSNNNQYLKDAVDGLASLKIEWNLLKDKVPSGVSFLNLRVLHGSPTFYKDGTFNFSFHKVLLNLVGNPEIYGTIDLELQSKFESRYSHALYENGTRFVHLNKNRIIQLDIFRKLLSVPEDKYANIRELTRNVIKPSLEEVNDRANFLVNLEEVKLGRKTTGYELIINSKGKSLRIDDKKEVQEGSNIIDEISKVFGRLTDQTVEYILNNYKEKYIVEKIAYTKDHAKKEETGYYPIRYFIKALKDNYKSREVAKDQKVGQCTQRKMKEWENQLYYLNLDLHTYQERLAYFQAENNKAGIESTLSVIHQCKAKIQQHMSSRPLENEEIA